MKKCPSCGFENKDVLMQCFLCKTTLKAEESSGVVAKQCLVEKSNGADQERSKNEETFSDTKECPFCAELIKLKAVKCKHCGERLNQENFIYIQKNKIKAKFSVIDGVRMGAGFFLVFLFIILAIYEINRISRKNLERRVKEAFQKQTEQNVRYEPYFPENRR